MNILTIILESYMATKNAEAISNEKIEDISGGAMTKAGRLAMELANEKKG